MYQSKMVNNAFPTNHHEGVKRYEDAGKPSPSPHSVHPNRQKRQSHEDCGRANRLPDACASPLVNRMLKQTEGPEENSSEPFWISGQTLRTGMSMPA
jgi:hypothetical protein